MRNQGYKIYNITPKIIEDIRLSIRKACYEGDMVKVNRNIERKQWLSLKEMKNGK